MRFNKQVIVNILFRAEKDKMLGIYTSDESIADQIIEVLSSSIETVEISDDMIGDVFDIVAEGDSEIDEVDFKYGIKLLQQRLALKNKL